MESDAQEAWDALQAISRAERAARRHSPNNGIVPIVWGVAVLIMLVIIDAVTHLAADMGVGMLIAGGCGGMIPVAVAAWTSLYRRRLPVQPRTLDRPRLYFWWGMYHVAVVCGGMAVAIALTRMLHQRCLPIGALTLIGVLDAAPLFWVGWDQRRRTLGGRG